MESLWAHNLTDLLVNSTKDVGTRYTLREKTRHIVTLMSTSLASA